MTLSVVGLGLAAVLFVPNEAQTDSRPGGSAFHQWKHKNDFASQTFWMLLHEQKQLKLSAGQVDQLRTLAADYTQTYLRNHEAVELAEVDVRRLIQMAQAEPSAIEAALQKSEAANSTERLDRAKAIRSALMVLTPEQLEAWKTKIHNRYHSRNQRPHSGNGEGGRQRVFNHDRAVETKNSEQAARRSANGWMGLSSPERGAASIELH